MDTVPLATQTGEKLDAARASSAGRSARTGHGRFGWEPATALIGIAVCGVVLGGLIAAATRPLHLEAGSWIAAYLVLVTGVAQCAMGLARIWWPKTTQHQGWGWVQVGAWNAGGALVVYGTLTSAPWIVDSGSVLLVIALAIALHASLTTVDAQLAGNRTSLWVAWGYRALLLILTLSIPIGIVLSHMRHS